jgi:NAD(P)-dependent dehydrogenase (short-subunit alcohol dehydrogenase family)
MNEGGSIVNMASIGSFFAWPGEGLFSTTKGGVVQLTRQLALEMAPRGVRANCVCPGTVDTPQTQKFLAGTDDPDEAKRELGAAVPLGRIGTPREIAECVLFLASSESSYVTGTAMIVDGGTTLSP